MFVFLFLSECQTEAWDLIPAVKLKLPRPLKQEVLLFITALHFFLNPSREVSIPLIPLIPLCPFSPFSADFASVRVKYYRTCPPSVR